MKRISSLLKVVGFNALFLGIGVFLANAVLDFYSFQAGYQHAELTRLEEAARDGDGRYFSQCLADSHTQVFYPDLLREPEFRKLQETTGFLPLGPVPNAPTAYCNEGYGFVTYRSDRFGFRNDDNVWNRALDALLVGDSYVQGACVPEENALSQSLTARTGLNVANVATASNSPNHYTSLLRTFVPLFRPRTVILFFYPNDNVPGYADDPYGGAASAGYQTAGVSATGEEFYRLVRPLLVPEKDAQAPEVECGSVDLGHRETRELIEHHFQAGDRAALSSYLADLLASDRLFGLLKLRAMRQVVKTALADEPVLYSPAMTTAAVDTLLSECSGECLPIVVLLPNSSFWRPDGRADAYFDFIAEYVNKQATPDSFRLLDARTLIDSDSLEHFAPVGPHYSVEGYELISSALSDLLNRDRPESDIVHN